MGIPLEIRRVKRPVNTVITTNGTNSAKRYAVRERIGVKYIPGGNPQPIYGKIIGHIIDFKFVPKVSGGSEIQQDNEVYPDLLSWGGAAFLRTVSDDIVADLLEVYDPVKVYTIMAMASLRVLKTNISSNRFSTHYRQSYVSVYYPGASLSKNSISSLLSELGQFSNLTEEFYQKRIARVQKEHHIAIAGTLRQDTSNNNDLSHFSYKARTKGCEEVSVLYAYDIELGEPVCASVFPGNIPDCKAYGEFIRTHNLQRGIIVGDKGYPSSVISEHLGGNKELHYFNPLKRDSAYIAEYDMLKFENCFSVGDDYVLCKKIFIEAENKYLFSFSNVKLSVKEYVTFVSSASKYKNFDYEKFAQKRDVFGLIMFETDMDLSAESAYMVYKSRWKLEVVFGYYKADITDNQTNVQTDFAVMGSEFINFISTLLTCRIVEKAQKAGLLKQVTYGSLIDELNMAWRQTKHTPCNVNEKIKFNDPYWIHTTKIALNEMVLLGLVEPDEILSPKSKFKRGRPPKKPIVETDSRIQEQEEKSAIEQAKRPRGRPPKPKDDTETKPKLPRGRPRKIIDPQDVKPKRPRGRPKKEVPTVNEPKRPRGRPRKVN